MTTLPNWNRLPITLSPRWYEYESIRRIASGGLAVAGGLSLFKAGVAGFSRSFVWVGIAVASFAIAGRLWTPSLNDPTVALRLRKKAGRDLNHPEMTFVKFFREYQKLLAKGILNCSDAAPFLERDIEQLDYTAFMDKHTQGDLRCKEALMKALSPEARHCLGTSGRVAHALNPSLPIPLDADPNLEVLTAKNWDEFITKYSYGVKVDNPRAEEALKTLFLQEAYKGRTDLYTYLSFFGAAARTSLKKTLGIFELNMVAEGKLPADRLVWNSEWKEIAANLSQLDHFKAEGVKAQLRRGFLANTPHQELFSEGWKERREIVGLIPEMIQAARVSIADECLRLPYLGRGGFREKYGMKYFNSEVLAPAHLEKIKAELREKLPTASSAVLQEVLEDLDILNLRKEILGLRWQRMSFLVIDRNDTERRIFFTYCSEVLAPEDLKSKIMNGIRHLSFFEIVSRYPNLFPNILKPTDKRPDGQTFAAFTEEAVQRAGKLEKRVVDVGVYLIDLIPSLIKHGLLSFESPALCHLIKSFLNQYLLVILEEEQSVSGSWYYWKKLMDLFKTKAPALETAYQEARHEVQEAKRMLEAETTKTRFSGYSSDSRLKLTEDIKELETQLRQKEALLRPVREGHWDSCSKIRIKTAQIKDEQTRLLSLQTSLQGLPLLRHRLQEQLRELERQTAPDSARLVALTRQLTESRQKLKAQEATHQQQLTQDPQRIALQAEIDRVAKELGEVEQAPTRQVLHKIREDIGRLSRHQSSYEYTLSLNIQSGLLDERLIRRTQESLRDVELQLRDLKQKLIDAKKADEPNDVRKNQLVELDREQRQKLAAHLAQFPGTEDLQEARKALSELVRQQQEMITTLEVWNTGSQEKAELQRKEAALALEIEKYSKEFSALEQNLSTTQTQLDDFERQEAARAATERELEQTFLDLQNSIDQKRSDLLEDPEYLKFQENKKRVLDQLNDTYQALLQRKSDELKTIISNILKNPLP